MAVRILLGYLIFSDGDNRLDQSYPVQNVIEGQEDSIHNTASQIGHSDPHDPNVEGNPPQSNRFYCINTKAIQLYASGLERTSENEHFHDHVHEIGSTHYQVHFRFHQSNQPKHFSLEQVFEQQKTSTMDPIPIISQWFQYLTPKRDGAFAIVPLSTIQNYHCIS